MNTSAKFWDGIAEKPPVYCYDRETILREMRETGFSDVEEREVGAGNMVAFVTAKKPG